MMIHDVGKDSSKKPNRVNLLTIDLTEGVPFAGVIAHTENPSELIPSDRAHIRDSSIYIPAIP